MAIYLLSDASNTVVQYPYSLGELRRDNPNVSFPSNPTLETLADYFMFPVQETTPPTYDRLSQDLTEQLPIYSGEGWVQQWLVSGVSEEEIASRTAVAQAECQEYANQLLVQAEQYYIDAMIAGYGFSALMQAYVDELSDVPAILGYPYIENITWPTLPATILDPSNPDLPVSVYTKGQVDVKMQELKDYVDSAIANAVQSLFVETRDGQDINILSN